MEDGHVGLDLFGIAWRLGATLFFVFLNGFFVAAEFALVKVRHSRIQKLVEEGSRRAKVADHLLSYLDRYLSACQLGITLASLALGALGEPAVRACWSPAPASSGWSSTPGIRRSGSWPSASLFSSSRSCT